MSSSTPPIASATAPRRIRPLRRLVVVCIAASAALTGFTVSPLPVSILMDARVPGRVAPNRRSTCAGLRRKMQDN
ncbi:hypothetical protein GCM10010505_03540 [Kitasatospora aburaviensis]